MAATTPVQLRIPDDLLARIDVAAEDTNRTAWILTAVRYALEDPGPGAYPGEHFPASGALVAGEPSPGVLCMGAGCWQRDTSRYGLRRLPLCPACAAALTGAEYRKPQPVIPPAWRASRGRQTTGAAS